MMGSEYQIARKTGIFSVLVCGLALMPCLVLDINAQVYTLNNNNSSAEVDVGNQRGMFNWTVDGQNELNQQWFWLAVGNNGPTAINNISPATVTTPSAQLLQTSYGNTSYGVEVDYLLTGGQAGSGQSDIGESITLNNLSTSPLTFHFYQYSDFNLGGSGTTDHAELGRNLSGKYNLADVQNGPVNGVYTILSETVATPGANHGEVETTPVTLNKLNGGAPVTLADNSTAGPGDVTWAFEWDVTVPAGGSFLISKDKSIQIVPEPSSLALISLGFGLCVLRKRRQCG